VPASPGVAQILGPGGKNLLIGRAANLRRWAASHLGAGRPPAKGKRPPTNLRSIAAEVVYAQTETPFQQKLVYERVMARHVPLEKRRDLKVPAFLHLDPAERFPRVSVKLSEGAPHALFGPFRDKRAAERARDLLHKAVPLRPCDYHFEPDPGLALGLGCLFAQVRSCAAPCLSRTSEEEYRRLAAATASRLAGQGAGFDWMPPWASAADGARGIVVDKGRDRTALFPVVGGRVLEEDAVMLDESDAEGTLSRLRWDEGEKGPSDWPWLLGWLASTRGRGAFVAVRRGEDQAVVVARLLVPLAVAGSSRGGA
jgi:hypothetical protein